MIKYGQGQGQKKIGQPISNDQVKPLGTGGQDDKDDSMVGNGIKWIKGKVNDGMKLGKEKLDEGAKLGKETINKLDEKFVQPIMRKKKAYDAFQDLLPTLSSVGIPFLMNSFLGGMKSSFGQNIGQMGQLGQMGQMRYPGQFGQMGQMRYPGKFGQQPKYYRSLGEQ